MSERRPGVVVELFAGVGGFRLGLEGVPWKPRSDPDWRVEWSNQWEPSTRRQDASSCYVRRFGPSGHSAVDIAAALDYRLDGQPPATSEVAEVSPLPTDIDLLVGGFPCQDYSVAKSRSRASGIVGLKGVLWWQIARLLAGSDGRAGRPLVNPPTLVLLENVDRLLKSPSGRRGHDFAVMLGTFAIHGYDVQWRVVDASAYGNPQRRKRVFILAERRNETPSHIGLMHAAQMLTRTGALARALPVVAEIEDLREVELPVHPRQLVDLVRISEGFASAQPRSPFADSGTMVGGRIFTGRTAPRSRKRPRTLDDVLIRERPVPEEFFVPESDLESWRRLKERKSLSRVSRRDGIPYKYSEGSMQFPDPLDRPARTILTGEGGRTPSRFKHVVPVTDDPQCRTHRRLMPEELEKLQGFPPGWTTRRADGSRISDTRRAFFMGNALVVDIVRRIGTRLAEDRREGRSSLGL